MVERWLLLFIYFDSFFFALCIKHYLQHNKIRNPEILFIFVIWHGWFLSDSKWAHYCEMIVNNIGIECVIEIYVHKEIIVRLNIC